MDFDIPGENTGLTLDEALLLFGETSVASQIVGGATVHVTREQAREMIDKLNHHEDPSHAMQHLRDALLTYSINGE